MKYFAEKISNLQIYLFCQYLTKVFCASLCIVVQRCPTMAKYLNILYVSPLTMWQFNKTCQMYDHHSCSVTRLGDFLHFEQVLKPLAKVNLPKSLTFLGNFCKGVKIYHFSSEIIFGQLLQTFGNFFLVTLHSSANLASVHR